MKKMVVVLLVILNMLTLASVATATEEYLNEEQVEALILENLGYPVTVELVNTEKGKGFSIEIPHRPWAKMIISTENVEGEHLLPAYALDFEEPYLQCYPWESLETVEYYNLEEMSLRLLEFSEDFDNVCYSFIKDNNCVKLQWYDVGDEENVLYHLISDWRYDEEGNICIPQHAVTAFYLAVTDEV